MHYSTLPRRRHYLVPSVAVFLADAGLASPARIVGAGTAPGHGATCFADARLLKPALCKRKSQDEENQRLFPTSRPFIRKRHLELNGGVLLFLWHVSVPVGSSVGVSMTW